MKDEKFLTRKRTYLYTVYNITLHPHPTPDVYIDFFEFIIKKKFFLPTGFRTYHLALHSISYFDESNKLSGFNGTLVRYENLLPSQFIDLDTGKTPENWSLDIEANIKYKPTFFNFAFYPEKHKLIFELENEKSTIQYNVVLHFFKNIFKTPSFIEKFTSGEIHTLTSNKKIRSILNNRKIKHIEFLVTRPNPDIFGDIIDEAITDYLEEQKAKNMILSFTAQDGEYLKLQENTEKIGLAAAENGEVKATIEDSNQRSVEISTRKFPLKVPEIFERGVTIENRLKIMASKLIPKSKTKKA